MYNDFDIFKRILNRPRVVLSDTDSFLLHCQNVDLESVVKQNADDLFDLR